jgi:hypothetical protein
VSGDAEALWFRLIVQSDDFGWQRAGVGVILGHCYPLRVFDAEKVRAVQLALLELDEAQAFELWEYKGHVYMHIPSWFDHNRVRNKTSKYAVEANIAAARPVRYQLLTDDSTCPTDDSTCPTDDSGSPTGPGTCSQLLALVADSRSRSRSRSREKVGSDYEPDFDRLWAMVPGPRKRRKHQEYGRYCVVRDSGALPPPEELRAKYHAWTQTTEWTKEGGIYAPMLSKWLEGRGWLDELPVDADRVVALREAQLEGLAAKHKEDPEWYSFVEDVEQDASVLLVDDGVDAFERWQEQTHGN